MNIDMNSEAFKAAMAVMDKWKPSHGCDEVAFAYDVLKAIEMAIEPYEKAQWQPIETAPKDGTNILLGNAVTAAVVVGKWAQDRWRAMYFVSLGTEDFRAGAGLMQAPTDWRPLPTPPDGPSYRERVLAQIQSGKSVENTNLDRELRE